ncbi:TetR family transcriptional regulator C-terminal domain-containing protein [Gammaproteobacteria bacterium]|nr:TetR family transcriptional regulator C-terminal domain-containing protein [Gammaproteobacteria bacterium]
MSIQVTQKNFASRNRKHQSEFRKRQLIEATMDCIDKLGLSQTTLARIAERVGISQGNVVFHFRSKEALLEQTLRHLNDEYQSNWIAALAAAQPDAYSQLRALLESSFKPKICNRRKISVWYAFWGESRSRPTYMRICGDNDKIFSDQLLTLCQTIEAESTAQIRAETAALSLEGMINGLWQNFLIGSPGFKRSHAIRAVFELMDSIYPDCNPGSVTTV